MKICSIICGAPFTDIPKNKVEGLVIAADRGLDYCIANEITPDYAVGDFDSTHTVPPVGVATIIVPAEKDDTDTNLAVELGLKMDCSEFRLFCALGGRLDHTIANLQTMYKLKKIGIAAAAYGDGCEAFFVKDETVVIPKFEGYLSVFAYSPSCVVSLKGVKYPLENHTLTNAFPLGISNVVTDEFAEIAVLSGDVLIIKQQYDV